MSEARAAFVALGRSRTVSFAHAGRSFAIARQTGDPWLRRADQQPGQPLADRSRPPRHSPGRTAAYVEQAILQVRARHGWGAARSTPSGAAKGWPSPAPVPSPPCCGVTAA